MPVCTGCSNDTLERLVLAVAEFSGVTRELMMPGRAPASRRVPSQLKKEGNKATYLFRPKTSPAQWKTPKNTNPITIPAPV